MAAAQTVAGAAAGALETVVVTAQKRSEKLQDVPISVSAFTGRDLREKVVVRPVDLGNQVTNLTTKNAVGDTAPIFSLRGISLNDFATNGTQPVGVYVDEVYQPNNSQLGFQLMDVERVEVLKGPQGTLYGRNTTAGAVSFITNKPTDRFGAGVNLTVGDYGRVATEAFVNGPLAPNLSGRIAFAGERQFDGYFTNDRNGESWGQVRRVAGRGQVLWQGNDTSVLVSVHGGLDRSDNWYYKYIADASGLPLGQTLQGIAKSGNPDIFHGVHTLDPAPFINNQDVGGSITAQHDYGAFSVKSITSGENMLYQRSEDYGSVPAPNGWNRYNGHLGTASEELRLTSTDQGRWKWIVGVFAGWDRLNESDIYNELQNPIFEGYVFNERYTQNTTSLAVFTNNTIELLPGLRLTLGGRYTYETRHYVGGTNILQSDPALAFDTCPCTTDRRLTYNVPTGKVGLDYRIGPTLVYATASTGYKAGGVTGFYVTDPGGKAPYQPEFVNAYEIGQKSDLLGNRLRLNASLFYYDYRDLQAFGVIDNEFRIFNVTKVKVDGAEIETQFVPFPGLTVSSGLGLLETRVEKSNVGGVNEGNTLGNAPKVEWQNTISYRWQLRDGLTASAALEAIYRGSTYYYVQNNPFQRQGAYWLFNPRIGIDGERWTARAFILNAGDRHYFREIFNDGGSIIGFPAPPRTFGFSLGYRWG